MILKMKQSVQNMSQLNVARIYRRSFIFLFVFLSQFFFTASVHAFTLSPTRQTIIIDQGKNQTVKVTITNDEKQVLKIKGNVEGFKIDEKTNRAIFGVRDEATDWVKISPPLITLAPGETKDIAFTFAIPSVTRTQVHYLGLFASVEAAQGQVGIASRVGSLLFLYTSGNLEEKSEVLDFSSGSDWYQKSSAQLFLSLQNTGTIHIQPHGDIFIKNWHKENIGHFAINSENHLLLPKTKFDTTFDLPLSLKDIGKIHARLEYRFGVNEQIIVKEIDFWYMPLWVIGGVVASFIFLFSGIIYFVVRKGVKKK